MNSLYVICSKRGPEKVAVRLFINEIYEFTETVNNGFENALAVLIEKTKGLIDDSSSLSRSDVIPWELRNDVRFLICVFEEKTGLTINDINIKYEKCNRKNWKATALINDVEYTSGTLAQQSSALTNLILTFLEQKQLSFLQMP